MIMGNLIKTLLTKSILPLTYIGILVFVLFAIKNRTNELSNDCSSLWFAYWYF